MLLIERNSTDPYFNIATEEYLIKNTREPIFMIWQNRPSVIIGKHQNPLREVNLDFVNQLQIPVIRRISGGGTVYHDLGNINYSFIDFGKAESLVNFEKYSRPIISLLQKMGVDANLVGKSDLKINGKKFSGNASHVYKNKVLHHGTLLFNSNLALLEESIKIKKHHITDKAVNSNRSKVTNISEHLDGLVSIDAFKEHLIEHIINEFPDIQKSQLSNDQTQNIQLLVKEKYRSWNWNFGYSPRYTISGNIEINNKKTTLKFHFYKGFINQIDTAELSIDFDPLIGLQHEKNILLESLQSNFNNEISDQILSILF